MGFDYQRVCCSLKRNMNLVKERPIIVQDYIQGEVSKGWIIGPLDQNEYLQVHTGCFGVIPKSTPGKWRLIVDMSSPTGDSVNNGIQESWCSLSYVTIVDGAQGIASLRRGALMAKVNIRNAYRVVPVHPDDKWASHMVKPGKTFMWHLFELLFSTRCALIITFTLTWPSNQTFSGGQCLWHNASL